MTAATAGLPAGVSLTSTNSGSAGVCQITTAELQVGSGTASATTDRVTLPNHGLTEGTPLYFSALSGGSGLSSGRSNLYFAKNITPDTFQLVQLAGDDSGTFVPVHIGADYTSVTVVAGVVYDLVDFTCFITSSSQAAGYVLITRSRLRGTATAFDPSSSSAKQGLIFNLAPNLTFIVADSELTPDAPINGLDGAYGSNLLIFRSHFTHGIDGVGSHGNVELYGDLFEKAAWFYPDTVGGHSDGTHNDTLMQIFGGAHHVARGCAAYGFPDPTVSSTTDPTNHPIPSQTNSDIQIGAASSLPVPSGLDVRYDQFGGGGYQINIAGNSSYPSLGSITDDQCHLKDALKGRWTAAQPTGIAAPAPNSSGVTVHCDIQRNVDENGVAFSPYVDTANGSSLVWP